MTLRPAWAETTARFASVVDLPSPTPADVTTSVLSAWSRLAKSRLVRSVRYASLMGERGSDTVINSFSLFAS